MSKYVKSVLLVGFLLVVRPSFSQTPNPKAKLLFRSGFETNTWLETVAGPATNQWPRVHGTDAASGMSWDNALFVGSPYTLLEVLTSDYSNPAPGNASDYIRNSIETVTGPYGTPTNALKMNIIKPSPNTCCTQDSFQISGIAAPIKDVYIGHWMRFNPEMLSQMQARGTSYWRMMFEMKTATEYRIEANIQWTGSKPYFHAHGDNGGLSGPPTIVWKWEENNRDIPVPMDQWFYTEFYLHRAADNTGRFFWAVNGQTVIDHQGPNYGPKMEEISALMLTNMYGISPTNWYQWLDDLEIWDLPRCTTLPCGARGATGAASDTQAPTAPASFTAAATSPSQVNLSWAASTDNVGVAGYRIYRNGAATPVATVSSTSYQDTALLSSTTYSYTVAAYDAAGNASTPAAASATTPATAPLPAGTSYLSDMTPTSATSGWGPIEKDRSNGGISGGDGRVLTLNGATYQKGLGVHAPSEIHYSLNAGCSVFASDIGVDDEVGSYGSVIFQVYGDSTLLYSSPVMTGSSATQQLSLDISGRSELRLVVTNGGDNIDSDHADWAGARITCGNSQDKQAPTVPTNLTATTASSSQIYLAWNASTDNVGVSSYRVYRNGGATPVAVVNSTTYQDTGLAANTNYSYTVAAYDAAGNGSAPSTAASARTAAAADTQAPSVPVNVTATVVSPSQINVAWTASTDNLAVAGYKVYRGGVQVGSVTSGTSYSDTNLSAGAQYSYTVAAYDAAGNQSAQSGAATAATAAAASASAAAIRINAGGWNSSFTAKDGNVWSRDQYYYSGDVTYNGSVAADDFGLYATGRQGLYTDFSYSIPVANGTYKVRLIFVEHYKTGPGQRIFTVTANGTQVLANLDILAEAARLTPLNKTFTVTVTNGKIDLKFIGVKGRGIVSGIEITQ